VPTIGENTSFDGWNGNSHTEECDALSKERVGLLVLGVKSSGKTMSLVQQGSHTERKRSKPIQIQSVRPTSEPKAIVI
jgi:hypothetical protein